MKRFILALLIVLFASPAFAWQNVVDTDYQYKFASTTAVNTVKVGPGFLHNLTVTGGTTSVIDIYDGVYLSSALMYSFTTTNTITNYNLDVRFSSGCVVYTNGALKYTVSYK